MIGILCSNENEEGFSVKLHDLFKEIRRGNDDAVIVFTILNIDFLDNTVRGSLISGKEVKAVTVPLPSVIFNFSVQFKATCIKALKLLLDIEGVELVNNVNRFDQSMIMEILSVSEATIKYLLPYYVYNENIDKFEIDEHKQYIEIPLKGTSIARIIYKKTGSTSDNLMGDCSIEKGHKHGLIKSALFKKRKILIEVPELVTKEENLVIIRTYVQRTHGKIWGILGDNIFPKDNSNKDIPYEKINEGVLNSISYISNFMPALGECFLDFLLSKDGQIYFLHLGGIGENFFELEQDKDFYKRFYKNLIKLASYLNYM